VKPQLPSRVPAVIDGLLELLAASVALDGVQVLDGPPLRLSDIEDDAIAVAPGSEAQPGVTSVIENQPGLGPNAYLERIEVGMTLASYSGVVNLKARRDRAAALLAAIKAAVDANQVREDAWDAAGLGPNLEWYPNQDESGCTVEIGFSLVFKALI
jgi:hypothetical protein